jgi:hypothetical protein
MERIRETWVFTQDFLAEQDLAQSLRTEELSLAWLEAGGAADAFPLLLKATKQLLAEERERRTDTVFESEDRAWDSALAIREEKERLDVLFRLARSAKTAGDYRTANAIAALLLDSYFRQGNLTGLFLEWETEDPWGESPQQAYYDLLVIRSGDGDYLDIPVPLLSQSTAIACLKQAPFEERLEHGGERVSTGQSFWPQLTSLVPEYEIQNACEYYLGEGVLKAPVMAG